MRVFHVDLAAANKPSGGETCMLEIIKYLQRQSVENVLITTDEAGLRYEKAGLHRGDCLRFITSPATYDGESNSLLFAAYVRRLFVFLARGNRSVVGESVRGDNILMCHSDYFPSTVATKVLSKHFRGQPYYWFHMLSPDISRGYEGHFTGRRRPPDLSLIHFKLNQLLFRRIARNATVFIVNPTYADLFKGYSVVPVHLGASQCGAIRTSEAPAFDTAFMGRFHKQKGLLEIPDILKRLKRLKPDISCLLIGGGDIGITRKLNTLIERYGLVDNVEFAGFVDSEKRFEILRKARVLLFPSYYESFGIVAVEAMACGLPVVAYDLPVFDFHEGGMIKVPVLDNQKFGEEVLKLLEDDDYWEAKSMESRTYASQYTWTRTGKEVYDILQAHNGSEDG